MHIYIISSIRKDASQRLYGFTEQGKNYTNLSLFLWHCSGFPATVVLALWVSKSLNVVAATHLPRFHRSCCWGQNKGSTSDRKTCATPAEMIPDSDCCAHLSSLLGRPHSPDNRRLRSRNSSRGGRWNARSSLPHPVQA